MTTTRGGDEAVSEVLGTILLTGITVALFTGLGLAVLGFAGPVDAPQSSISLTVAPGAGGWGTGDEALVLRHHGGEPLFADDVRLVYGLNGGSTTELRGPQLNFTQGRLAIGQEVHLRMRLGESDVLTAQLVALEANTLIATQSLVPGLAAAAVQCATDAVPPTITAWNQTPANLTGATNTSVSVRVALADDCAGVHPSTAPQLLYRTSSSSAWTSLPMSTVAPNEWGAAIPQPSLGWSSTQGATLEYHVAPLVDARGNTGQSGTRSDLVDPVRTLLAPSSAVASVGGLEGATSHAFGTSAASDGGLTTTLREGSRAAAPVTLLANATISAKGWSDPAHAHRSDNARAEVNDNNPSPFGLGFTDPPRGGPVLSIVVALEQSIEDHDNDGWAVQACVAGDCGPATPTQQGTESDSTLLFDVTALLPSSLPSWNATNLSALEINVLAMRSQGRDDTWRVDNVSVIVIYSGYDASLQLDWSGSALNGTRSLVARYNTSGEPFLLQVWNWASGTWSTRATLAATAPTDATHLLAPSELQPGTNAVRVRILDADAGDGARADGLALDHVSVVIS